MDLSFEPRAERASVSPRPSRLTDPGLVDAWFQRVACADAARRAATHGAHALELAIGDDLADAWFV